MPTMCYIIQVIEEDTMLNKLNKAINIFSVKYCIENLQDKTEEEKLHYIFNNAKKIRNQAITDIAKELNLARGTVTRWMELKNIPKQYEFDILKLCQEEIDYTKYSAKQKDQFYTSQQTAKHCYSVFKQYAKKNNIDIENYQFIEPSVGDGSFTKVLPEDTIIIDVDPKIKGAIVCDYLDWHPEEEKNYIVFGNPPFGLRGHLALKFIEHSYAFADYVCFILPQLFESDGKGSPRKRIKNYNLVHSEGLNCFFHDPSGREMKINVVFQIWSKHDVNEKYNIKSYDDTLSSVYSLSNGISPSNQRNTKMIGKCDFYLPSTCFGENNMRAYERFEDLPGKTIHDKKGYGIVIKKNKVKVLDELLEANWNEVAFLSTNSAINLRTSNIKEKIQNIFDKLN